jgi:hypothetical protein
VLTLNKINRQILTVRARDDQEQRAVLVTGKRRICGDREGGDSPGHDTISVSKVRRDHASDYDGDR